MSFACLLYFSLFSLLFLYHFLYDPCIHYTLLLIGSPSCILESTGYFPCSSIYFLFLMLHSKISWTIHFLFHPGIYLTSLVLYYLTRKLFLFVIVSYTSSLIITALFSRTIFASFSIHTSLLFSHMYFLLVYFHFTVLCLFFSNICLWLFSLFYLVPLFGSCLDVVYVFVLEIFFWYLF